MKISLTKVTYGFLVTAEDGRELFFQNDDDFVPLASTFGWSARPVTFKNKAGVVSTCNHRRTDGTVGCADCGTRPREFFSEAVDWLYGNAGLYVENSIRVDDPGYF